MCVEAVGEGNKNAIACYRDVVIVLRKALTFIVIPCIVFVARQVCVCTTFSFVHMHTGQQQCGSDI